MMNVRIYQINHARDTHRLLYMNSSILEREVGEVRPDSASYDCVFDGQVNRDTLEGVYQMFNLEHPAGYVGRFLSVSDVVEVMEGGKEKPGFYFCDSIGFKKVPFEPGKVQMMKKQEPHECDMTYQKMASLFRAAERNGQHLTGYIVFSQASFTQPYSVESRTYVVSSNNKAYLSQMSGYSIYASSLDGTDRCVRLERYMASEKGGPTGWQIERCYMMSDDVERARAILQKERERER